jgi:excisionase family DNA binding protein
MRRYRAYRRRPRSQEGEHTVDDHDRLLTITEAAALVRTPVATLRYWRHRGTGSRSFRLGRHVLYRREDVTAWIDARREGEDPERPGTA